MDIGSINFLNAAILPAELLAALLLFASTLKKRPSFPLRLTLGGALMLAFPTLVLLPLAALSPLQNGPAMVTNLLYSFTTYGAAAALLSFCYQTTFFETLYYTTCAYLTQHFTYCSYVLICPKAISGHIEDYSPIYLIVYGVLYWAAWFILARKVTQEGWYQMDSRRALGTTMSAMFIALLLSALGQQLAGESEALYRLCLVYAMVCCFYILWEQVGQQQRLTLQHKLDIQEQLWLQQKNQYELSAENVELINRKCHDLKHQIAALKLISDQAKRDESIRSLEKSVMIYDSIVETGNEILDTVLTEKSLICEDRNIELTCVADGACLSFMDAVDIYTIFGNALDNAIECVSALAEPEQRVISVLVFSKADVVIFQLENYHAGGLSFDGGLPKTSKAGEQGYHGFGLKSIRYTAEKYHGVLTVQTEDQIFLLRVTIPIYGDA